MKKFHAVIQLNTPWGVATVTQAQAIELLGVHPKTAHRWAHGQQRITPERAKLLAILSGQVEGFRFVRQQGPAPNKKPFAVLVSSDGRRWVPDELRKAWPVKGC